MSACDRGGSYKRKLKLAKSPPTPSTALVAVALQEHLSKQYSLSVTAPLPKRTVQHRTAPPSSCNRCGKHPHHSNKKQQTRQSSLQINTDTLALNSNGDAREVVRPVQQVKRAQPCKETASSRKEVERVLDEVPPPLSLAQRLGLVEAPPSLLSSEQWVRLKKMSNLRQDSAQPCPICHEPFGLNQQVLLSCSHVFHLSCLTSLERFSGSKRCPMCRQDNYQKRIIYEGAHYHRNWAAIVIQSSWRGYVVRKWYSSYRDKFPPKDPTLRRRHFEKRLEKLTDGMLKSCDERSCGAESVLAESDRALECARQAMRLYSSQTGLISTTKQIFEHTFADSASPEVWSTAYYKAKEHSMSECPVCLVSLHPLSPDSTHQPRPIAILSCGHLFHVKCIESLERHCHAHHDVDLCPLCRTPYLRQLYNLDTN